MYANSFEIENVQNSVFCNSVQLLPMKQLQDLSHGGITD